jgi:DNA-binding MarR family transcriptional regulator
MDIKQFISGINFIRDFVHKDFAFPQLSILLIVSQEQGITQSDLAERLKIPQVTISRNVAKLGHKMKQGVKGTWKQVGYELIETRPYLYERRMNAVYLTKKGEQIIKGLKKAIK